MMSRPYAFLEGKTKKFFDEGAEFLGEQIDLMGFSYEEDSSFGMVARIVEGARTTLGDLPPDFARAALWVGDSILDAALDGITLRSSDGKRLDREDLNFNQLNQLDFISLVLLTIGRSKFELGDEEHSIDSFEVTPARFCAAYALRMIYNGTRDYLKESEDLRDYYLMQAATAFGFMQAVTPTDEASISDAVSASLRRDTAKRLAAERWKRDPKGQVMESIKIEWKKRKDAGQRINATRFAKDMAREHRDAVTIEAIKNAQTRWNKEYHPAG